MNVIVTKGTKDSMELFVIGTGATMALLIAILMLV